MGRLAGLFLMVAMLASGMPAEKIHAHEHGDRDHHHSVQWVADTVADQEHHHPNPNLDLDLDLDLDPADAAAADAAGGSYHAHEAATTASALTALPVLLLGTFAPVAPTLRLADLPPASAARIPPHRPPIA